MDETTIETLSRNWCRLAKIKWTVSNESESKTLRWRFVHSSNGTIHTYLYICTATRASLLPIHTEAELKASLREHLLGHDGTLVVKYIDEKI